MVAPGVGPAARLAALSGTVPGVPGPLPCVVLQGAVPPPHWACVSAMLAQPTVSKPVVATLLRTPANPASAPRLPRLLLGISEPRAPVLSALLLSIPWI